MAARCRYREVLDNIEARVQRAYRGREPSALIPRMTPSAELDKLVLPKIRCAHLAHRRGRDARLSLRPADLADLSARRADTPMLLWPGCMCLVMACLKKALGVLTTRTICTRHVFQHPV